MLKNVLQSNYCVILVDTIDELKKRLQKLGNFLDAVFLDCNERESTNLLLIQQIRDCMNSDDIPIIAIITPADVIFKPFHTEKLKKRINMVVNTRRMLNQINRLKYGESTGLMSLNNFYYEGAKQRREEKTQESSGLHIFGNGKKYHMLIAIEKTEKDLKNAVAPDILEAYHSFELEEGNKYSCYKDKAYMVDLQVMRLQGELYALLFYRGYTNEVLEVL